MTDVDREAFLAGYLAEAEEHVTAIGRHLVAIEAGRGAPNVRAAREVFRALHTIKGLSAMIGVEPIVAIAHAMEGVVRAAERAGGTFTAGSVDQLAQAVRAIEQRLAQVAARKLVAAPPAALLAALAATDEARPAAPLASLAIDPALAEKLNASDREQIEQGVARGLRCSRLDFTPTPALAAAGVNITAIRERVSALGEIVRVIPLNVPRSEAAPAGLSFALIVLHAGEPDALADGAGLDPSALIEIAAPAPALGPADDDPDDDAPETRAGRVVRVEVARLDDALERLSDLIVSRFRMAHAIAELAGAGIDVRRLEVLMVETARQLRDLRGSIMRARMVPVAELLERVPLIVRGLARTTGKAVTVQIDAGRAELDKAVAERLLPAIVHLVRNAVDHAIETSEVRVAAGKPAEGVIRVSCHDRSSNQLELSITDDGRGVDREGVARRAGVAVPDTDEALLELIARPGLSTVERATTTSGRGVGVDIVHRIVRELGGELRLETQPGRGTTFTLRVPLSITIVDAFSFMAAGEVFVVPVAAVDEVIEVDHARTTRGPQRTGASTEVKLIERRGAAIPLVDLARLFDLPGGGAGVPPGLSPKAIVVRRAGSPYAFMVDRMLGQQEVVVRPVIDPLIRVPGVTGSTDLGDGKPVLVLDLTALTERLIDECSPVRGAA